MLSVQVVSCLSTCSQKLGRLKFHRDQNKNNNNFLCRNWVTRNWNWWWSKVV